MARFRVLRSCRSEGGSRRLCSAFLALLTVTVAALAGCGSGEDEAGATADGSGTRADAGATALIAVSVLPLAGIVDRLLPEGAARIGVIVPAGASPHSFEPGMGQLTAIQGADLVVELGHPAFVWERGMLEGMLAGTAATRVRLSEACESREDDPHVWLDPDCLIRMSDRTARALARVLPDQEAHIRAALDAWREEIATADVAFRARLAQSTGSTFLVQHPAWGYFAEAYGLTQLSILSHASHGSGDRGSARLARIIDLARELGIRTVIVQPQVNQDAAVMVAAEIGATVREVDPLARDPLGAIRAIVDAVAGDTIP